MHTSERKSDANVKKNNKALVYRIQPAWGFTLATEILVRSGEYSTNRRSLIYLPRRSHLFPECEGRCTFTHDDNDDDVEDDDDGSSWYRLPAWCDTFLLWIIGLIALKLIRLRRGSFSFSRVTHLCRGPAFGSRTYCRRSDFAVKVWLSQQRRVCNGSSETCDKKGKNFSGLLKNLWHGRDVYGTWRHGRVSLGCFVTLNKGKQWRSNP